MSTGTNEPTPEFVSADERRRWLTSVTRRALKRHRTKLSKQQQELAESERHNLFTQYADTILASLKSVHKGMNSCVLENVHSGEEVTIKLNPALGPQENAALYFKKARKGRRAVQTIEENVSRTMSEISELEQIMPSLAPPQEGEEADSMVQTLQTAEQRLEALGVLPRRSTAGTQVGSEQPDVPFRHIEFEGHDIYVGRNDRQNDELTVRFARPWDLWLHVAQHAGSHVVIRRAKNTPWPPERVLGAAAALAAWFSKAKHAGTVDVHVAERRHVQKRRRTPAGEVTLLTYKTIRTKPVSPQQLRKLSGSKPGGYHG